MITKFKLFEKKTINADIYVEDIFGDRVDFLILDSTRKYDYLFSYSKNNDYLYFSGSITNDYNLNNFTQYNIDDFYNEYPKLCNKAYETALKKLKKETNIQKKLAYDALKNKLLEIEDFDRKEDLNKFNL